MVDVLARARAEVREVRVPALPLAALGAAAAWAWFGASWVTPAFVVLAAVGAVLAVVDVRTHRLPDAIVLPAAVLAAALLGLAAVGTGDVGALARAALGGAVAFVAHAGLKLVHPAGLGFGDVKLAGLLGAHLAWLGWANLAVGALAPFLLGGAVAGALLVSRRAGRRTALPFGPFMVAGAVLGVVAGDAVAGAYALG